MELKHFFGKSIKGLMVRTDNATEMNPSAGKIPALWQEFDESVHVDYRNGERVYGVYYNYESDHTGQFSVLAGYDGNSVPQGVHLEELVIPQGRYLVFAKEGTMPQIAIDAWTEVWRYFSSNQAEFTRLYTVDFEYYSNTNSIEVYIAVE